jgi:hypothetical protein
MRNFIEVPANLPPLSARRLRDTWLLALLNDRVDMATLTQIAGTVDIRVIQPLLTSITPDSRERAWATATGATPMANRRKMKTISGRALERERCAQGVVPWKALKVGNLTVEQCLSRATYLVDSFDKKSGLIDQLEAQRGRPRVVPWRAFLILAQFHFLHNGTSGQLEQIKNSALLVRHRWGSLGIDASVHVDYEHIESSLEDMRRLFEPSDSPHRFDANGTSKGWRDVGLDIDEFTASYLANSVDDRFTSTEYAFDATHYETWARNFALTEENPQQHGDDPITFRTAPVVGHDGRLRYSKDLDARPGQYTNNRAGARADDNITNGFDIEGWCMIPPLGSTGLPSFTVGMGLRPMGPPDMTQLGKIIDALGKAGRPVTHAVFDKGYVNRLELPGILLDRSVTKTVDLLPVQLGTHPVEGGQALWIDGGLFSSGTYRGCGKSAASTSA